jgi:putative ABC transport system substrate-binding protein
LRTRRQRASSSDAANKGDKLPFIGVAVIVAPGVPSTIAAKSVTPTVPIAFAFAIDPVQLGLVASLKRPGGNLTGISAFGPDFGVKGLQVLHELLAATASVGFLANLSNTLTEFTMRDVLAAAATS